MTGVGYPALAIFAGGRSTRMGDGVDKAEIVQQGLTVPERLARCGQELGCEPLVIGRPRPSTWHGPPTTFLADEVPGLGPLGALSTVLAQRPLALCVACDMPALEARSLGWLLGWSHQPFGDAVVVSTKAGLEPLFALYRDACLSVVRSQLAAGMRAMHRLIPCIDARIVSAPDWLLPHLANLNTQDDWRRYQPSP